MVVLSPMAENRPEAEKASSELVVWLFKKRVLVGPGFASAFAASCRGLREAAFSTDGPKKEKMKEEHIEVEGVVAAVLPGTLFHVELDNKHVVLATICGKMRKRWVRLTVGDRVKMDMSPYDLNKGLITWRLR